VAAQARAIVVAEVAMSSTVDLSDNQLDTAMDRLADQ
jgi:hypothetical protein